MSANWQRYDHYCDLQANIFRSRCVSSAASANSQLRNVTIFDFIEAALGQTIGFFRCGNRILRFAAMAASIMLKGEGARCDAVEKRRRDHDSQLLIIASQVS
jgi:hypothetical protein